MSTSTVPTINGAPVTERVSARFWGRVRKTDSCWLWQGGTRGGGYGYFTHNYGQIAAHRFAYQLLVGPIPEGKQLDHVRARGCTSRLCVNPAHLEPVECVENIRRGDSLAGLNARKTHCKHGHAFTPDNIIWRENRGRPRRTCRECNRMRQRIAYYRDRKAPETLEALDRWVKAWWR